VATPVSSTGRPVSTMTDLEEEARQQRLCWARETAWWDAALTLSDLGYDCTVLDPDAEADEDYNSGNPDHGVIQVRRHTGLGWTLLVSQTDSDLLEDEEA
jgi:hypothetical protein